jgi:hypothetical protein
MSRVCGRDRDWARTGEWKKLPRSGFVQPVFVGALPAALALLLIVVKAGGFLYQLICDQNVHMPDDSAPGEAAPVHKGSVAGERLVCLAVAEGKQRGVGCPDRAAKEGQVAARQLFVSKVCVRLEDLGLQALLAVNGTCYIICFMARTGLCNATG